MKYRTLVAAILSLISCLAMESVFAAEFSCPPGLAIKRGQVPHPWFDDIPVPSAWCIDKSGKRTGHGGGGSPKPRRSYLELIR